MAPIDKVKVVGKFEAIETVEIMGYKGQLPPEQVQMRAIYQRALISTSSSSGTDHGEIHRKRSSKKCSAASTTPSQCISNAVLLKENPPGPHWDGSWALTSK
jgi:hypothetical protein